MKMYMPIKKDRKNVCTDGNSRLFVLKKLEEDLKKSPKGQGLRNPRKKQ